MGLWPTQGDEKHLDPASTLNGAVTLSLSSRPERSAVEGPAVPQTFRGNVFRQNVPEFPASLHWTGPRMHLSLNERRMMLDNATNLYRKSGVAQLSDLRFLLVLTQTL